MAGYLTDRQRRNYLIAEMKLNRSSHEAAWREIANSYLPYRLRLNLSDTNRGDRRNQNIYDSTIIRAVNTFESGFMTAATDPTSEWVSLSTKDTERYNFGAHKNWFSDATQVLLDNMDSANTYVSLPTAYGNTAGFGFSAVSVEESFGKRAPFHTRVIPTGQGWYGQDEESNVNTFYEEHRYTVRQAYLKFGEHAEFSTQMQNLIDNSKWEEWVDVGRLIRPNEDYREGSPLATRMAFSSCWFELGTCSKAKDYMREDDDKYLLESGFHDFPIAVFRWDLTEGDIYPNDYPGVESLGDNKSLQIGEKRSWQGVEKLISPHWVAPESLRGAIDNYFIPNEITFVDERDAGKSLRPAHLMDPAFIQPLEEKQNQVRTRIRECFHYPTFSTFDSIPDKTRTATEIMERKGEKLLKLVKPYSIMTHGGLRPMVDLKFKILARRGYFPPAPPDLADQPIDYKFNGVLANAQKLNRVQPNQAIVSFFADIISITKDPNTILKLDIDQAIDVIATNLGCDPSIIRSDETVQDIRAQQQKAQQQAQAMATAEQGSKIAKNLSGSPLDTDNALAALTGAR